MSILKRIFKIYLFVALLLGIYIVFGGAFVNQDYVVHILEKRGYTNVQITDHQWFFVHFRGCSGRIAKFKVTAIDPGIVGVGRETKFFACADWSYRGVVTGVD